MNTVSYGQLVNSGQLEEIGRGGEGRVMTVGAMSGTVYKEYLEFQGHLPNRTALEELINLPQRMSASDRQWIAERTTWPHTVVEDGGRLKGFLMPVIGPQFFRVHGARAAPKRVACEWNYLSLRHRFRNQPNIVTEVPDVTPMDALGVVLDLARTMKVFHEHDVVLGDLSGRNLLWTDTPRLAVMVIDCDSFRYEDRPGVAPSKQSPDWEDPALTSPLTTRESDKYKLALAAYRAVWSAGTERPDPSIARIPPPPDGVPAVLGDLVERGLRASNRPEPGEWVKALENAVRFAGRPVITLKDPADVPMRPERVTGPIVRPTIQMKTGGS